MLIMLQTIGSGQMVIFNGHDISISYSDHADVEEGEPLTTIARKDGIE